MSKRWLSVIPALFLLCLAVIPAQASAQAGSAAIPRPAELQDDVDFWINVYSQVTTNEGYLHDDRDLGVVYATLRFAPDTTPKARQAVVDDARKRYQAILKRLAAAARGEAVPAAANAADAAEEKRVRELWGEGTTAARYEKAVDSVRFQLGQAERFRAGLVRAGAWEGHIAEAIANMGLPPELAALPHVESSFNPAAYSKVGAAGLWQFMRSTGRRYMRIDNAVDERMDPFRSTEAAAQLLAYNYRVLGTWPLALTAYNHGAAGMRRAVDATGTTDFVRINRTYSSRTFGFASRNFYPSFLAALTIHESPEKYFGPLERAPEARFVEVETPAWVPASALVRVLGIPEADLRRMNPALLPTVWNDSQLVPKGYKLRLPPEQSRWTAGLLAQRLSADEQYAGQVGPRSHRVSSGETLSGIAARYGLSTQQLASMNDMSTTSLLRIGHVLRLPGRAPPSVRTAASYAATAPSDGERVYVVRRGDTLSTIAERVNVSAGDLMRLNSLRNRDYVYEGQRLRLAAPDAAEEAAVVAALGPEAATTDAEERVAMARTGGTARPAPVTRAERESAEDAAAAEQAARRGREAEPVSAAQAEALGPALVPGIEAPAPGDAFDYSVAADGTIRVAAAETVGHYADWLGIGASRVRSLNKLRSGQALLLGRRVALDFSKVSREVFEQRRRDYHNQLQANFFAGHRILGTEVYVVRRGDSLWRITQRYAVVPMWLLQQYNPDLDFGDLRPGGQIVMPRVEELATAGA